MAENSTLWTWGNQQKYHTEVKENIETKLTEHIDDDTIHLTAEKAIEATATTISNPNLLVNPDFKINQRGLATYTGNVYSVDRWYNSQCTVTVNDDSSLTISSPDTTTVSSIRQFIKPDSLTGKTVTISVDCDILTEGAKVCIQLQYNGAWTSAVYHSELGRQFITRTYDLPNEITTDIQVAIMLQKPTGSVATEVKVYSAKLEIGSVATQFVAPDPLTEKVKCGIPDDTSTYGYRAIVNADSVSGVTVSDNNTPGLRKIYSGTSDLTAGTSTLESGAIYLVYE